MQLSTGQQEELFETLQSRFKKHPERHKGIQWAEVHSRLEASPEKLWALNEMENTGGDPDVVGKDKKTGEYIFFDCSKETPRGRRKLCYDREALESRKAHKPENSAMELAESMRIELMNEEEYRQLQELGDFDTRTSSWLKTPAPIRKLGGAIFGDRRFDHVFIYHNGADSYYGARGFRGVLRV